MKFNLFVYCTVGRREELEAGMAGKDATRYRRMLGELAATVRLADDTGYFGFGHPEHHLQIEGFEAANDPCLMAMWFGQHSRKLRIIPCGFVSTTNNPLVTAEKIATLDCMLGGRLGVGLVRGYQARWLDNFRIQPQLQAVGPWNAKSPVDEDNREYFAEFVDIVLKALREDTFQHRGKYWNFPTPDFRNPHDHPVYANYGQGVSADMRVDQIGIAPRPWQREIPLYGGFSHSLRSAKFWAKHKGRPIVLADNLDFLQLLWREWGDEARRCGNDFAPAEQACWGGVMVCAPTDAQAWDWHQDMAWMWDTWMKPFGQGVPELLVGSPETLKRRIEAVGKAVPLDEVFLLLPQAILAPEKLNASVELFAREVMPHFAN
ncbi:MAG: LLM class flavin-dependent oxidoreductase [Porticoccaceae bacterium]